MYNCTTIIIIPEMFTSFNWSFKKPLEIRSDRPNLVAPKAQAEAALANLVRLLSSFQVKLTKRSWQSQLAFFQLSQVRFHSFIHSFIFFIFFHLLRDLWLRCLRMLLLQRMPGTWIRGHNFLAASMRFSSLFCVQKTEASTQQAMTQAGRSCNNFGFSIFWGAWSILWGGEERWKGREGLGGLPLKCWIGMDQGRATFTFLACHSEMQICQGKGKPRDDGLFLEYFHVFSCRVVGVGSGQPWFSNSLRRTSQKRPRKGQREGQSKLSVLDERSDWLKSFVWNCLPLDHTWLKCMILQDPLILFITSTNINKHQHHCFLRFADFLHYPGRSSE